MTNSDYSDLFIKTIIDLNNLENIQALLFSSNQLAENELSNHRVTVGTDEYDVLFPAFTGWLLDHVDEWFFLNDLDGYEAVAEAFWAANPIWAPRFPL